jgi:hypothetical protein
MSRTHPRTSVDFKKNVTRRKERETDREILRLFKLKHEELFGEDKLIDRVKIRRFMKEFRKSLNRKELTLQLETQA